MDQEAINPEELNPEDLALWAKMLAKRKQQPVPPPGISGPNSAVMTQQPEPGADLSTSSQIASAQMPQGSPPQPPPPTKLSTQQALQKLISGDDIAQRMGTEQGQVEEMKKQLTNYMKQPKQIDFSPLAALTDSWTGSKFAHSYKAPQSDADRAETMAKLQNIIAQRQGDLTKQQIALLSAQVRGQGTILGSEKDPNTMWSDTKRAQMDQSAHERMLNAVKKDPTYNGMAQKSRLLTNALDYLDQADITTPEQFNETQSVIRKQLGLTGTSGVDERDRTIMNSLGLKGARAQQYLFGKPVDVKETSAEFMKHLRELVNIAQQDNIAQANAQLSKLTSGNPALYERNPSLKRGRDELISASKNQFSRPALSAFPLKTTAPEAASGGAPAMSFEEFKKRKAAGTL